MVKYSVLVGLHRNTALGFWQKTRQQTEPGQCLPEKNWSASRFRDKLFGLLLRNRIPIWANPQFSVSAFSYFVLHKIRFHEILDGKCLSFSFFLLNGDDRGRRTRSLCQRIWLVTSFVGMVVSTVMDCHIVFKFSFSQTSHFSRRCAEGWRRCSRENRIRPSSWSQPNRLNGLRYLINPSIICQPKKGVCQDRGRRALQSQDWEPSERWACIQISGIVFITNRKDNPFAIYPAQKKRRARLTFLHRSSSWTTEAVDFIQIFATPWRSRLRCGWRKARTPTRFMMPHYLDARQGIPLAMSCDDFKSGATDGRPWSAKTVIADISDLNSPICAWGQ
jgi:hypothetical protein